MHCLQKPHAATACPKLPYDPKSVTHTSSTQMATAYPNLPHHVLLTAITRVTARVLHVPTFVTVPPLPFPCAAASSIQVATAYPDLIGEDPSNAFAELTIE